MADCRPKRLRGAASKAAGRQAGPESDAGPRVRRLLRLIAVAYLFLGALYATSIPPGKGPDETAHVRYVQHLAEQHRLPVFARENPGPDYEFHQPPLFYLLCLPAYLVARGGSDGAQAVRLVTMLIGVVLIYLTFGLGRTLAPDRPWVGLAAAAAVAFLPMHLGLVASVSNDALTEVFFAAALLLMVRYLRAASDYRQGRADSAPGQLTMSAVGIMIGLGLLTKSVAVLLLPVAWATALLACRGPRGPERGRLLRDLGTSTGIALAIAGWWLWRNQALYGDLLAQNAFLSAFRDRPSPEFFMSRYGVGVAGYVLTVVVPFTIGTGLGAFGPVFGNRFAFFPYWVYLVFTAKATVEALSFARHLRRAGLADWQCQAWAVSAWLGALLLASFIRFNFSFFQAQARYLFPALPPATVALCLGLEQLAPPRWSKAALALGIGLLLLLAAGGLFLWIVPQFQLGPPRP